MTYPIPPARVTGGPSPAPDMNNVTTLLGAITGSEQGGSVAATSIGVALPQYTGIGPVTVSTEAETIIAQLTIPAGASARQTWRIIVWGTFSVGANGGAYTVKTRIGGLTGNNLGSITTGSWNANATGSFVLDACCTLDTTGSGATWSGFIRHSSLAGAQTNTASSVSTGSATSLTSQNLVITILPGSTTMTIHALDSAGEQVC